MRTLRLRVAGVLMLACLVTAPVFADPPQWIAYQGVLTLTAGKPVTDGMYDLRFRVYDRELPDTGQLLFEQTVRARTVRGRYAVVLQTSGPEIPRSLARAFDGGERFMEVAALGGTAVTVERQRVS